MPADAIHDSAKTYTGAPLRLYDLVVLQFSNSFTWKCSTKDVLLPFFQQYIGTHAHLDIGVGSGYYLAASAKLLSDVETVTLVDLAPDALKYARDRLKAAGRTREIETVEHDIFQPFSASLHGRYDSISLFYVFHCLPGKLPSKADDVFTQLKTLLKPDGVVYGATILGQNHNLVGAGLVKFYNSKGVFSNYEDSQEGLEEALQKHFADVEVKLVGRVVLFVGKTPIFKE